MPYSYFFFTVEKPMLVFASKHYIKQIDLRGMETEILINNLTNVVAVDYDYSDNCFYWSDITNQGSTIKRKCKDNLVEVRYIFKYEYIFYFLTLFINGF
jgi:integrin beta 2